MHRTLIHLCAQAPAGRATWDIFKKMQAQKVVVCDFTPNDNITGLYLQEDFHLAKGFGPMIFF